MTDIAFKLSFKAYESGPVLTFKGNERYKLTADQLKRICTCNCHLKGFRVRHIMPCCAGTYMTYMSLVDAEGNVVEPSKEVYLNTHEYEHVIDLDMLYDAVKDRYWLKAPYAMDHGSSEELRIPTIRRPLPGLLAESIVGVNPMTKE